jgi:5-methylcytosine-specific restriction endonuclease McrA
MLKPACGPLTEKGSSAQTFSREPVIRFAIGGLQPQPCELHPSQLEARRKGQVDSCTKPSEGENNWVFFGHVRDSKGRHHAVRLFRASSVPIRRHTKIKGEANPYDPMWEPYLEAPQGVRMARHLKGRRQLLRLWKEQDGLCVVCQQRITQLTGWHSHHLVWRTYGGSDRAENRVLLHPNCHAQVHSQGLTGVKPRLQAGVGKA